ncbi:hypothetical protein MTO96_023383 [Rhipicephalus appendiculatus]
MLSPAPHEQLSSGLSTRLGSASGRTSEEASATMEISSFSSCSASESSEALITVKSSGALASPVSACPEEVANSGTQRGKADLPEQDRDSTLSKEVDMPSSSTFVTSVLEVCLSVTAAVGVGGRLTESCREHDCDASFASSVPSSHRRGAAFSVPAESGGALKKLQCVRASPWTACPLEVGNTGKGRDIVDDQGYGCDASLSEEVDVAVSSSLGTSLLVVCLSVTETVGISGKVTGYSSELGFDASTEKSVPSSHCRGLASSGVVYILGSIDKSQTQPLHQPLHQPPNQPLYQPLHQPLYQPRHDPCTSPPHQPLCEPLHQPLHQPVHHPRGVATEKQDIIVASGDASFPYESNPDVAY